MATGCYHGRQDTRRKQTQKKRLIYDIRGPALTPRREEEMLVVDY